MDANPKKKLIIGGIAAAILVICCTATFLCTRRYYTNRIAELSSGTQQSVSDIGRTISEIGDTAASIGSELGDVKSNNEQLQQSVDGARELNNELQSKIDEVIRLTEDYSERSAAYAADIERAGDSIDKLLDTAIEKSELYEQYFTEVQSVLGLNGPDTAEQQ